MKKIDLNHWYLNNNNLSISLMKYCVNIITRKNSYGIYYQLIVLGEDKNELIFNFYTLEDSISFTENIVNKSNSFDEIVNEYETRFKNGEFSGPQLDIIETPNEDSKVIITTDKLEQIMANYYGNGKRYKVTVEHDLNSFNTKPQVLFYLIEHLDYDGIKKEHKILLTNHDVESAINDYLSSSSYELVDYKYLGDFHYNGYHIDPDKSTFTGVELTIKEKEKNYILIKNK